MKHRIRYLHEFRVNCIIFLIFGFYRIEFYGRPFHHTLFSRANFFPSCSQNERLKSDIIFAFVFFNFGHLGG